MIPGRKMNQCNHYTHLKSFTCSDVTSDKLDGH